MSVHAEGARIADTAGRSWPGVLLCAIRTYVAGRTHTRIGADPNRLAKRSVIGNSVGNRAHE